MQRGARQIDPQRRYDTHNATTGIEPVLDYPTGTVHGRGVDGLTTRASGATTIAGSPR